MHTKDNWCSKEFHSIKFGDARLTRRFLKVADDLLNNPGQAIHAACGGWAEAKGAYRLLDNDKVLENTILRSHQSETVQRLEASTENTLFAIQDTTVAVYTHHPQKTGIHKLNKNAGFDNPVKGFFLHNTLLMTEQGVPLGLLDQKVFQNEVEERKGDHKRRQITEKQSFKWIESLRTTHALCKNKHIVHLCDRESDIFEFFMEAENLDASVLVRASNDRILICDGEQATLWKHMEKVSVAGIQSIHLPARHNQKKRDVNIEVRYDEILVKPPQRYAEAKATALRPIKMWAIWLREINSSAGIEPLEWMLLTNMPVTCLEKALRMGKWYRLRWQIECYHRILKTGCKIEECRLESYERLIKYIRLQSVIAFRLFWLTMINRIHPENSCDTVLDEHEWKALCCYINKVRSPPLKIPTIREAIRMIAKLGGFLGRRNDGEPGMTYIWRGWEKLSVITDFWLATCATVSCG